MAWLLSARKSVLTLVLVPVRCPFRDIAADEFCSQLAQGSCHGGGGGNSEGERGGQALSGTWDAGLFVISCFPPHGNVHVSVAVMMPTKWPDPTAHWHVSPIVDVRMQ